MKSRTIIQYAGGLLLAALATTASAQLPFLDSTDSKPTLAPLLKRVAPAVVSIFVEETTPVAASPLFNDPLFERFFGRQAVPEPRTRQGAGSGVIIDADEGYVITNHHVIANATEVVIVLNDKRRLDAEVVGSDQGTDIALLRVDADNLTGLALGDSETLEVGDFVLAIGNPFGLGQTVTSGIVSALGRGGINADGYEDFIQTDASINPGNSGGALIDLNGQLVGINSAIIAPAGGNVGIGFAVPSTMASAVVRQLLEYGEVRRGMLGVSIEDLTPEVTEAFGLDVDAGAVVREVSVGSAAERAGLQAGDVIVEFDGHAIDGSSDLRNQVGLVPVDSTVALAYYRDGRRHTIDVTIGEATQATAMRSSGPNGATIDKLPGAHFRNLGQGDPQFGRVEGVVVESIEADSPIARIGLEAGDVITAVGALNRYNVRSVDELASAMRMLRAPFALYILRGNRSLFLTVR